MHGGTADTVQAVADRSPARNIAVALQSQRDAIAKACARHGVVRLEVFGSALCDDFDSDASDIDLLVELGPMEPYARVEAYLGLLDELRQLLHRDVDWSSWGPSRTPTSPGTSSARRSCSMPPVDEEY